MSSKIIWKKIKGFKKYIKKFLFSFKAFTLLELIIVITILSILWVIVFYSVTWFVKTARDASRNENLNRIDFWIDLFVIEKWFYPKPDNGVDITYSWSKLWTQWTFWDKNFTNIWKLSIKPTDIIWNNDFSYSLANDGKQYELWAIYESDELLFNSFFSETYARSKVPVRSMVVWNYNWLTLSTATWGLLYILTLPTILSYDIEETDIVQLIDKKTLAYRWYWNIAASYSWTIYKIDWWFDFDPNTFVVYAWSYDDLINNESEWIDVLDNIQQAYSWSVLENEPELENILSIDIDTNNPSKEVRELAYDVVVNDLDIDVPIELTSWDEWITYDISDWLIDSDTRSITQDSLSNMWFATKKWVSTFIWNTWWVYDESDGLIDKDVRDVIESTDWDMWFATNKWVSVFDWINWTDYNKSDGLIDNDVVDILEDSSWNFWFATKKGLSMFDGTSWEDHKESDWISDKIVTWITETLNWDIWISTINWVSVYNWSIWNSYNVSDWLTNKNVLTIYTDKLNNLWFGTINWVSKFDGLNWISYNEYDWLINKRVNDIYQDNEFNIWFATMAWASKYDWVSLWQDFTTNEGLADKDVQVIFQDNNLNMWFWTKKWVTIYFH